jgi:saccharopine dehydrogenase (NAD+, L-lysine-forming)
MILTPRGFPRGGGTLLDLEFLQDDNGCRVVATTLDLPFSHWSLKLGHGNSLVRGPSKLARPALTCITDPKDEPFPSVSSYPNENDLIAGVKKAIKKGSEKTGQAPRVLAIGALGRCGSGTVDLCLYAGLPTESVLKWDLVRTSRQFQS